MYKGLALQFFFIGSLEGVLLMIAVPASVVLLLQTVLALFGIGGHSDLDTGTEVDIDTNVDMDADPNAEFDQGPEGPHVHGGPDASSILGGVLSIFSIRNIVAFFTFFGWGGLWLMHFKLDAVVVIILATLIGALFVSISMLFFYVLSKLQRSGTLVLSGAMGCVGQVYIPIPAERGGRGKVMIVLQGALQEIEAVTDESSKIQTGEQVRVVAVLAKQDTLVVERVDLQENTWKN